LFLLSSTRATFVKKIDEMKKFVVLGAALGIAIFIIANLCFGKVMYDYHAAHNVLITEPNQ
jgi:hypothetical protein